MMEYKVNVIIEPKSYLNDPEGETILKDLIIKNGYSSVKGVRTAKMLIIDIEANNELEAKNIVRQLCDELRIYNPLVSNCKIECNK
jgi:phosphoribosylformylglycinamidine synthase